MNISNLEIYVLAFVFYFVSCASFLLVFYQIRNILGLSVIVVVSCSWALFLAGACEFKQEHFVVSSIVEVLELGFLGVCNGFAYGVPFAVALECIPFVGRLSDVSRGMQFAEQSFGPLASRSSLLESFANLFLLVLIFSFEAYLQPLQSFLRHLISSPQSLTLSPSAFEQVYFLSSKAFQLGLFIALPVVLFLLLFDISIVFVARSFAKVNLNFELLGFKAMIGLLLAGIILANPSNLALEFYSEIGGYFGLK